MKLPPNVVRHRPSGRFRGKFIRDGKQFFTPLRDTPEDAYMDVRVRIAEVAATGTHTPTLGEALDRERADAIHRGVSPATIASHDAVARFLLGFWRQQTPLRDISVSAVVGFVTDARDRRGRSTTTIRQKDLALLDRAFQRCRVPSPIRGVLSHMRHALRAQKPTPATFTSLAEVGALIAAVRRSQAPGANVWDSSVLMLLACSGARAGEFGRLTGKDISLDHRTLYLESRKGQSRLVPIPEAAMDAAATLLGRAGVGPVIPGGMREVSAICRRWARRLGEPRLTARNLRRAFCSFGQSEAGIPLAAMRDLMGHSTATTTNRYMFSAVGPGSLDGLGQRLGG